MLIYLVIFIFFFLLMEILIKKLVFFLDLKKNSLLRWLRKEIEDYWMIYTLELGWRPVGWNIVIKTIKVRILVIIYHGIMTLVSVKTRKAIIKIIEMKILIWPIHWIKTNLFDFWECFFFSKSLPDRQSPLIALFSLNGWSLSKTVLYTLELELVV